MVGQFCTKCPGMPHRLHTYPRGGFRSGSGGIALLPKPLPSPPPPRPAPPPRPRPCPNEGAALCSFCQSSAADCNMLASTSPSPRLKALSSASAAAEVLARCASSCACRWEGSTAERLLPPDVCCEAVGACDCCGALPSGVLYIAGMRRTMRQLLRGMRKALSLYSAGGKRKSKQ